MKSFKTSESVTEGHPDKVCDIVSDAIVDAYLQRDRNALVSVKALAARDTICIGGESAAYNSAGLDIDSIVREAVRCIGYDEEGIGFDSHTLEIIDRIDRHPIDDYNKQHWSDECQLGSRDQGIVFGYACNETEELLPISLVLARRLSLGLSQLRRNALPYLKPDGKTQVTVEYEGGRPIRAHTVVLSTMHSAEASRTEIENALRELLVKPTLGEYFDGETSLVVNPTGRFIVGGPAIDTGLTGRKIVVDTYGGHARHGGGAFSGKDPTSTDRSGAYLARYVAKNIVAAGLAERCEIGFCYAIGSTEPIAIEVDTFGTGKIPENGIESLSKSAFDLTISRSLDALDLRRPIYTRTAREGHFGNPNYGWEKLDHTEAIREAHNYV